MTDIEKQALALLNKIQRQMGCYVSKWLDSDMPSDVALISAFEMLEAHKREVSDAVKLRFNHNAPVYGCLSRFIIPDAVDPLVEALNQIMPDVGVTGYNTADANLLRTAMKARGYAFTKIEEGQP